MLGVRNVDPYFIIRALKAQSSSDAVCFATLQTQVLQRQQLSTENNPSNSHSNSGPAHPFLIG